jgi:hypothetical protein
VGDTAEVNFHLSRVTYGQKESRRGKEKAFSRKAVEKKCNCSVTAQFRNGTKSTKAPILTYR